MKYLLEIDAEDKIAFAEELFRSMPFVKVLQALPEKTANEESATDLFAETFGMRAGRDKKTLGDIFGKFDWDVDGLEYQKAIRNEWE
jgi:hypothetical protein